jgi:hypothetical protein
LPPNKIKKDRQTGKTSGYARTMIPTGALTLFVWLNISTRPAKTRTAERFTTRPSPDSAYAIGAA